jgi:hypothetical protein
MLVDFVNPQGLKAIEQIISVYQCIRPAQKGKPGKTIWVHSSGVSGKIQYQCREEMISIIEAQRAY